ncbi:MAG: hypothetical protein COB85_00500 [Bacteroidetes bacterium]|nr:MAG: hypothetical protein COB85_00500 [Bacteroidota bacterium]
MVLTADNFNTPIPGTGPVVMDTYFESPSITVVNPRASYWVAYHQAIRYCCSGANRLVIQASTDNFATFEEYDATNGIATNAAFDGINYINISTAVGDSGSFKIRFVSEGNTHYYWMIDDFAVIEGAENDLQLNSPYLEFNFDYVFVETVGVGQSEVEIAGLADTTVLVLVPESGDEIQNIKSGIMEIADIFVVNKADRQGADSFANNLESFLHTKAESAWKPPVVRSVATSGEGVEKLIAHIDEHVKLDDNERKHILLAEKAYHLIQNDRMANVDKSDLQREVADLLKNGNFNLYSFVKDWAKK